MPFLHSSFLLLLLLFSFGFPSCTEKKLTPIKNQTEFIIVTDDLGRNVKMPRYPKRVIGLSPSATEMLYAVADEKTIIGRTQNCDYPARVKQKPVVNNYPMDYETLVLLKPDLVFSVDGITSMAVATKLERELHIPVYFQKYEKVEDIFSGLTDLGKLLHREERAGFVVDSLRTEINKLKVNNLNKPKRQVLAITWNDPIYVYGRNTLFSDKLRFVGAENVIKDDFAQSYPALTREYILRLNPDIIIGGSFEEMDKTFFMMYPELKKVTAYQNKKIFKATDNLMARPSPRVVSSIQELKSFIW